MEVSRKNLERYTLDWSFPWRDLLADDREMKKQKAFKKKKALFARALERRVLESDPNIPKSFVAAIFERSLNTEEDFGKHDFTDIFRLASRIPYLEKKVDSVLGMRPLPIRTFLTNTFVFSIPRDMRQHADIEFVVDIVTKNAGDMVKVGDCIMKLDVLSPEKYPLKKSYILVSMDDIFAERSVSKDVDAKNHSFRLDEILCKPGSVVRQGTPLFRVDTDKRVTVASHQVKAINFLNNAECIDDEEENFGISGAILRLETGLGKTLISIAYSLCAPTNGFPTLIVCSKSLMSEWLASGFEKFFHVSYEPRTETSLRDNTVHVLRFHKDFLKSKYDSITRDIVCCYDFVLVTFDVITNAFSILKEDGEDTYGANSEAEKPRKRAKKVKQIKRTKMPHITEDVWRSREESDDPDAVGPSIIYSTPWCRAIVDESTKLGDPKTKIFKAMMSLYAENKICLTAEPIVNKLTDLYSQLRFIGFNQAMRPKQWQQECAYVVEKLENHILSMTTKDTEIKLPPIKYFDHRIAFDEKGYNAYRYVVAMTKKVLREFLLKQGDNIGVSTILSLLTRLRQLCIAPWVWFSTKRDKARQKKAAEEAQEADEQKKEADEAEKVEEQKEEEEEEEEEEEQDVHVAELLEEFDKELRGFFKNDSVLTWMNDKDGSAGKRSPKLLEVSKMVRSFPRTDKVIIFSTYVSALKLMGERLAEDGIGSLILDGNVSMMDRQTTLTRFANDPFITVLLMTTKVGGFGLNITCANRVIFLDRWWNEVTQMQATRRVWRLGQTKEVSVHFMMMSKRNGNSKEGANQQQSEVTIEDAIDSLCKHKDAMSQEVFGGGDRDAKKNMMVKLINML